MTQTAIAPDDTYLEIKNLSKSFGTFNALDNISLRVKDGDFVCFLGPSGCGKTTLLRCIAGLEIQSKGNIFQRDVDISTLPPQAVTSGSFSNPMHFFPI